MCTTNIKKRKKIKMNNRILTSFLILVMASIAPYCSAFRWEKSKASDPRILIISVGSKSNIWAILREGAGTAEAVSKLSRWDGRQWIIYENPGKWFEKIYALPNNDVYALYVEPTDIGKEPLPYKVVRFNRKKMNTVATIRDSDGPNFAIGIPLNVNYLVLGPHKILYYDDHNVYQWNGKSMKKMGAAEPNVISVICGQDETIFRVATTIPLEGKTSPSWQDSLSQWDGKEWKLTAAVDYSEKNFNLNSFAIANKNNIWRVDQHYDFWKNDEILIYKLNTKTKQWESRGTNQRWGAPPLSVATDGTAWLLTDDQTIHEFVD